ncbi:ASKHA domain-containing protein [Butyrivibrio sp. AE3003]|uniref:ASKHA domain-containing protein n=1 Tax=Butyrivibrio sp. AE3003 TaxID=1496721 RepID=UPI00047B2F44|nr:ASKHA domain-containing protein [Butyrivibrio sp. AE3003]
MKKIRVGIEYKNNNVTLETLKGKQLKGLLADAGFEASYPCGGVGRCGKCKVRFTEGAPYPNTLDKSFLSEKEIAQGVRLLCRCSLETDCKVCIDGAGSSEEDIVAETAKSSFSGKKYDKYGIAVDIGTTTIAAALVGVSLDGEKEIIDTAGGINHQRRVGADVISRIAYASGLGIVGNKEKLDELRELVLDDISALIEKLGKRASGDLAAIVVTGNTTMLHIFRGLDIEGLGKYPYKPVDNCVYETEMFGTKLVTMPGISAFVGADIVSGIYCSEIINKESRKELLLDLGTNGEMAFFDGKNLKVTSTAAGPVFEGGTISCGVASIPGAVCHVDVTGDFGSGFFTKVKTIGDKDPIGLCGTGVMEAVSELVRNGIADKSGLLADEFFDEGFALTDDGKVSVSQHDIRNIQLAKGAVYTGLKELVGDDAPDKVYVAGGFGTNLNYDRIRYIRLFPDSFAGKAESIGNSALKGAVKLLSEIITGRKEEALSNLNKISECATEVVLANKEDFDDSFVDAMNF